MIKKNAKRGTNWILVFHRTLILPIDIENCRYFDGLKNAYIDELVRSRDFVCHIWNGLVSFNLFLTLLHALGLVSSLFRNFEAFARSCLNMSNNEFLTFYSNIFVNSIKTINVIPQIVDFHVLDEDDDRSMVSFASFCDLYLLKNNDNEHGR